MMLQGFHPLDQFEILPLFVNHSVTSWPIEANIVTNLTIILFFNVCLFRISHLYIFNKSSFNAFDLLLSNIYILVKSIIKSNTNLKRHQYFSILYFLFFFILIANLVGLIPYSFTITSSFVITFFLALMHFTGINIIGIVEQRWKITNLFLPSGVPLGIAPFLIIIEIVSYFAKVFSLSIRLFANMMSGHALLKILIGFSWTLLSSISYYTIIALFPWILVTVIMFLEALIAFLQAYVFTILVTIYINDVLTDH